MVQQSDENVNARNPLCPLCGVQLDTRGDAFWCTDQKFAFSRKQIEKHELWTRLQRNDRIVAFKALDRERARDEYCLTDAQVDEVERWIDEDSTAVEIRRADVSPEKEALLSLARSVDNAAALCELVDNAMDAGLRRPGAINVSVTFNPELRTLTVVDDAGGMNESDLEDCLKLGAVKKNGVAGRIGRYGIGAKEAIYHFGREVTIKSHLLSELGAARGIRTIVQEDWLKDRDWKIKIESVSGIPEGTTTVEIGRINDVDVDIDGIKKHLWETYERRLLTKSINIEVNGSALAQDPDFNPLYPPEFSPRTYRMKIGLVNVELRVMLIAVSELKAGIALYAHGRKFSHIGWENPNWRFVFEKVPRQNQIKHVRVEIDFDGPVEDIPISANKDSVQPNGVLEVVRAIAIKAVDPYFKVIPVLAQRGAKEIKDRTTPEAGWTEPVVDLGRVSQTTQIPATVKANIAILKEFVDPPGPPAPPTHPVEPRIPQSSVQVASPETPLAAARSAVVQLSFNMEVGASRPSEVEAWLKSGVELGVLDRESLQGLVDHLH